MQLGANKAIGTRHLVQPGPVHRDRMEGHSGRLKTLEFQLEAGMTVCEAVAGPLGRAGLTTAALDLTGMRVGPMQFVMPTYSSTPDHVAYYSDTHHRDGPVVIEEASATFGSRDGKPFLHCHALWHDSPQAQCGGHILPYETIVVEPSVVRAWGTPDVDMRAEPDPETNFTLFGPAPLRHVGGDLLVIRIRPNVDLIRSVETLCQQHCITDAILRSAIGSTVGARFEDGRAIDEVPTEILGLQGWARADGEGAVRFELDVALIDAAGTIHRGWLARGENPVLICAELFLEVRGRIAGRTAGGKTDA